MRDESQPMSFWAELERVYRRLLGSDDPAATDVLIAEAMRAARPLPAASAAVSERAVPVAKLRDIFGLSPFETDVLLLCAGAALDRRFGAAVTALQPETPAPTLGLAASVLEEPHWSALSRARPLRYWRLIEIGPGSIMQAPLSIDERVLQSLLGVRGVDDRLDFVLQELIDDADPAEDVSPRLLELAARGALHWRRGAKSPLLLTGNRSAERAALFHAIRRAAGLDGWALEGGDLPEAAGEREQLARAYTREAALWPAALLVRTERLENPAPLEAWLRRVSAPVAVDVETGSAADRLSGLRLAAPSMTASERKARWRRGLGPLATEIAPQLDAIVESFALDGREIAETAESIVAEAELIPIGGKPDRLLGERAWALCRMSARRSLDGLALHVEHTSHWSDLVLPDAQTHILHQVALHARHAGRVNEAWGFADRYARGLGLSALFSGASGTGKTMAAGVLAHELDRDLYQIDLATVVSKYIGQTEKHLRKIFDAAERSGAILLFDEADALFGKRSQVRDSHDRYANMEVSYLLQRMESYRGIAILTTNMQNSLDAAFQRRLRFVVHFPFPDEPSRQRIWRNVFPAAAPIAELDYQRLAQLNVTGGSIRNIAVSAAFLAADAETAITMKHVLEAARSEYGKLGKPLSPAETRGWQ